MSKKSRRHRPRGRGCPGGRDVPFTTFAVGTGTCDRPGCRCQEITTPWSYTVGRSRRGRAELLTTGLSDPDEIAWLCGRIAHEIDAHDLLGRVGVGQPFTMLDFGDAAYAEYTPEELRAIELQRFRLDEVGEAWLRTDPGRMAHWVRRFRAGDRVTRMPTLLQIVWSDEEGRFPDDPTCELSVRDEQALLADDPFGYPPLGLGTAA